MRHPGAPVGTRTNILINALRRSETGEPLDPIAAVIEAKGCWNAQLFSALETQLVGDYMVQVRAPVGIYLVGWFGQFFPRAIAMPSPRRSFSPLRSSTKARPAS